MNKFIVSGLLSFLCFNSNAITMFDPMGGLFNGGIGANELIYNNTSETRSYQIGYRNHYAQNKFGYTFKLGAGKICALMPNNMPPEQSDGEWDLCTETSDCNFVADLDGETGAGYIYDGLYNTGNNNLDDCNNEHANRCYNAAQGDASWAIAVIPQSDALNNNGCNGNLYCNVTYYNGSTNWIDQNGWGGTPNPLYYTSDWNIGSVVPDNFYFIFVENDGANPNRANATIPDNYSPGNYYPACGSSN